MSKLRPEYQKLIKEAEQILNKSNFVTVKRKIELWSTHQDIRDEFFNRPGEVKKEEMVRQLAEKYNYSPYNIEKIIYLF